MEMGWETLQKRIGFFNRKDNHIKDKFITTYFPKWLHFYTWFLVLSQGQFCSLSSCPALKSSSSHLKVLIALKKSYPTEKWRENLGDRLEKESQFWWWAVHVPPWVNTTSHDMASHKWTLDSSLKTFKTWWVGDTLWAAFFFFFLSLFWLPDAVMLTVTPYRIFLFLLDNLHCPAGPWWALCFIRKRLKFLNLLRMT
jgi:hypothetical protein